MSQLLVSIVEEYGPQNTAAPNIMLSQEDSWSNQFGCKS